MARRFRIKNLYRRPGISFLLFFAKVFNLTNESATLFELPTRLNFSLLVFAPSFATQRSVC